MVRKHWGISLIILLFLLSGCGTKSQTVSQTGFEKLIFVKYPELKNQPFTITKVKRVVDGDTIETSEGDKVRFIGVNSPESIGKVEYFGKEASSYTKSQLSGKTVYLFKDVDNTDKYGRLLRYLFIIDDDLMYNERLAREGYANPMTIPPNVMYAKLFVQAERAARENNRGLWANGSKNNPADSTTVKGCEDPKIKGNINAKGDKIYHVPGGKSYSQTVPEALFCTEQEATDAGFRKANG